MKRSDEKTREGHSRNQIFAFRDRPRHASSTHSATRVHDSPPPWPRRPCPIPSTGATSASRSRTRTRPSPGRRSRADADGADADADGEVPQRRDQQRPGRVRRAGAPPAELRVHAHRDAHDERRLDGMEAAGSAVRQRTPLLVRPATEPSARFDFVILRKIIMPNLVATRDSNELTSSVARPRQPSPAGRRPSRESGNRPV